MIFYDRHAVGELSISTGTDRIETSLTAVFSTLFPGLLSIVGFALVLLSVNWRLGLIAVGCAPMIFVSSARYTRLTRQSARLQRASEGRLAGVVAESLQHTRLDQRLRPRHGCRSRDENSPELGKSMPRDCFDRAVAPQMDHNGPDYQPLSR